MMLVRKLLNAAISLYQPKSWQKLQLQQYSIMSHEFCHAQSMGFIIMDFYYKTF